MEKLSTLLVCISMMLLIYNINYIYRRVAMMENLLEIRKTIEIMEKELENGND